MLVDKGRIGATSDELRRYRNMESRVGEFMDVLAVSHGKKPLAALDVPGTLARKNIDKDRISQILAIAKSKGVHLMVVSPSALKWGAGGYLRYVFYKPRNKWRALALMGVLWGCTKRSPPGGGCGGLRGWKFHAAIGYLLGYTRKNIREFVRTRSGKPRVSPREFSALIDRIKKMRFRFNREGFYNPVLKSTNALHLRRSDY